MLPQEAGQVLFWDSRDGHNFPLPGKLAWCFKRGELREAHLPARLRADKAQEPVNVSSDILVFGRLALVAREFSPPRSDLSIPLPESSGGHYLLLEPLHLFLKIWGIKALETRLQ